MLKGVNVAMGKWILSYLLFVSFCPQEGYQVLPARSMHQPVSHGLVGRHGARSSQSNTAEAQLGESSQSLHLHSPYETCISCSSHKVYTLILSMKHA